MDIKSPVERSLNMSKIRSKDTKPEKYIRSLLHKSGLRFRVNYSEIAGTPDIYFTRNKVAVFVHGCFWHRHMDCKYAYNPKSRMEFWQNKFCNNQARDEIVRNQLDALNIRVLVAWECTIRRMKRDEELSEKVRKAIIEYIKNSDVSYLEI